MGILICIEVVMRYFFNAPTVWANETTQMIFGAYSVLAGGYLLLEGRHVSVDVLVSKLPERVRNVINIVTSPLIFFFCGMLFYVGGSFAWESLMGLETSQSAWDPPVYPLKLTIPLGALLLILQAIAMVIRNIVALGQEGNNNGEQWQGGMKGGRG